MALLLGAIVVYTSRMNDEVRNSPEEDLVTMRRQLTEMEEEIRRLQIEKERVALREAASRPAPTDLVTRGEAEEKVGDLEERLKQLEREAEEARADAARAEAEAGLLTERHAEDRNKLARRARLIHDAMLIATIQEWVEDPNFGGFATLKVESPDNVQSGTVLAIRRNGGILGKLRVEEVTIEGAVANPMTRFDEVKPEPGDELILNSIVELAP